LEVDANMVVEPGLYPLAVVLDWAGEKTAALLEIEYTGRIGDRVLDFVVRRNLTSKPEGGVDVNMFWEVGSEVLPGGVEATGGIAFDDAIWKISLDSVPAGVLGTDLGATISSAGLVRVSKLPVEGVDTVDLFVLAESGEVEKRQRRGVIRFNVVRPAGSVVDFTVYRSALNPQVDGLSGLRKSSEVRFPVVLRDGGDLFRGLKLRLDGTVGVDLVALDGVALNEALRGLFEVRDAPVEITGRLTAGQSVVNDVRGASQSLVGSVVTGYGVALGTKVIAVEVDSGAELGRLTLSSVAEATGVVSLLAESRVLHVAVDCNVVDPARGVDWTRLEWTIPSNYGRLRLNMAQMYRDAVTRVATVTVSSSVCTDPRKTVFTSAGGRWVYCDSGWSFGVGGGR
jgi:hypothetical protein